MYQWISLIGLFFSFFAHASTNSVSPKAETTPIPHSGDAADDIAVWIHPQAPSKSYILGTDKKGGIAIYNLQGQELAYHPLGKMNNIDLRGNTVIASNRTENRLEVLHFDHKTLSLTPALKQPKKSNLSAYGVCMYRNAKNGTLYGFLTGKKGKIEQWEITPNQNHSFFTVNLVRTLSLKSKAEGCVADDVTGDLYVSEEEHGIWKFSASPNSRRSKPELIDSLSNPVLANDLEGIALYGDRYLIVSSQGNNSYAVYDRKNGHQYLTSFEIRGGLIDGTSDTDGIEAVSNYLGPDFPLGLFIAQDGTNKDGSKKLNQNFKIIDWQDIHSKALAQ